MQPSDESEYDYNAKYFDLGAAFAERHPDAADTPGGLGWHLRGVIGFEKDEL